MSSRHANQGETAPLLTTNHNNANKENGGTFGNRRLLGTLAFLALVCVAAWVAIAKLNGDSSAARQFSSPVSKYKRVQGLGFQIYTGGAPAFVKTEPNPSEEDDNNNNTTAKTHRVLNPECIRTARYGQMIGDEEEGNPAQLQCYLGLEDPSLDVTHRLNVMKEAVETAFAQADPNPQVLKVFIAPEFFWRGVDGAYEFASEAPGDSSICGPVCQILHGLETLVAEARFADWIFLFGTVTAWESLESTKTATMAMQQSGEELLFYNFAPLYKGYDPTTTKGHGPRFIVPKRYVSSSDFLTPERHLHPSEMKELIDLSKQDEHRISVDQRPNKDGTRTAVINPHDFAIERYNNDMWNEYRQELDDLGYVMIKFDWLILDGLTLTVEICLDHQMRTALTAYLADMVTGRNTRIPSVSTDSNGSSSSSSSSFSIDYVPIPTRQAAISLVASAGMTFAADALALTDQGVGFLQDGLSNETNYMAKATDEDVCDTSGWEFHGGTEAIRRRAFLSPTDIIWEHASLGNYGSYPLYSNESAKWQDFLDGIFSTKLYRPHVVVFDPVDIPR